MFAEILLALLIGILAGIFTGLIPGIHINLLGVFLISLSSTLLLNLSPIYLVVFITSMAITHTFVDFIPSVFLGCPDTDTELSILPGHELLKKGKAHEAILLSTYGGIFAIIILILTSYPSIIVFQKIYPIIKLILPYVLIATSIFLISIEKRKINSFLVFVLSGILGLIVLNLESLNQPLLPLLTGLFGASSLILTIKTKPLIPPQTISKPKEKIFKPLIGAMIASPLCSFLPGLGSGQAAIIGNTISNTNKKSFLILLGATNTLVMGFSFISLYAISKTRTGAAVAISEIIGNLSPKILILILICVFISGIIGFFLTNKISVFASKNITKINYSKLSLITLVFLTSIILLVSGLLGVLIFIVATFTGIYCISQKVRRTNMMGCLLIPTILLYLV
jgi:putative membrane protein